MYQFLSQAVRSVGNKSIGFIKQNPARIASAFTETQRPCFSTQLVPGIGRGKTSTGLVRYVTPLTSDFHAIAYCLIPMFIKVGLAVDHDAVPKMIVKYQALLDKMEASDMPADAEYRKVMEKIFRYRIKVAQENLNDPEKVEELCNCGQVEELVVQADNEMIVLDMYLENRWWEYVKNVHIEYEPTLDGGEGGIEWDSKLEKNQQHK